MLVAFVGKMGSGKTLSMSYFGNIMQQDGYTIASNYGLRYPHRKITKKEIEDYGKKNTKTQIIDTCFLLDEAQTILDCREFHKHRLITYWILQTRKRRCHIFYTTQQFFSVEKRLRENTDFVIECEPIRDNDGCYVASALSVNSYLGRGRFCPEKTLILKASKEQFGLYDTNEIIRFDNG
jgi:hypothetical protein